MTKSVKFHNLWRDFLITEEVEESSINEIGFDTLKQLAGTGQKADDRLRGLRRAPKRARPQTEPTATTDKPSATPDPDKLDYRGGDIQLYSGPLAARTAMRELGLKQAFITRLLVHLRKDFEKARASGLTDKGIVEKKGKIEIPITNTIEWLYSDQEVQGMSHSPRDYRDLLYIEDFYKAQDTLTKLAYVIINLLRLYNFKLSRQDFEALKNWLQYRQISPDKAYEPTVDFDFDFSSP